MQSTNSDNQTSILAFFLPLGIVAASLVGLGFWSVFTSIRSINHELAQSRKEQDDLRHSQAAFASKSQADVRSIGKQMSALEESVASVPKLQQIEAACASSEKAAVAKITQWIQDEMLTGLREIQTPNKTTGESVRDYFKELDRKIDELGRLIEDLRPERWPNLDRQSELLHNRSYKRPTPI